MRDLIASKPDFRVQTSEMVSHFKINITGPDVMLFKKMLKGIADFEKSKTMLNGGSGGWWVLKEEFR